MDTDPQALTDAESAARRDRAWRALVPARAAYLAAVSAHYDEVLHEVAGRAEDTGSLGKSDIAALVVWKRLSARARWVGGLMAMPDAAVRAVTERAVAAARDPALPLGEAARTARGHLAALPGFGTGDALASAVLTAAAPRRMAVYDRRVQQALDALDLPLTPAPGRYGRYLELLDGLLVHGAGHADGWTPRDLDTALYWAGGPAPSPVSVPVPDGGGVRGTR